MKTDSLAKKAAFSISHWLIDQPGYALNDPRQRPVDAAAAKIYDNAVAPLVAILRAISLLSITHEEGSETWRDLMLEAEKFARKGIELAEGSGAKEASK